MTTKITKDSVWHKGRITAVKKLGGPDNEFGCYCACGKKLRLTQHELTSGPFPHDCGTRPIKGTSTALALVPFVIDTEAESESEAADDEPDDLPAVVSTGDNGGKLEKLKTRLSKLDSVFKDEVEGIQHMLNNANSDSAITKFQKQALVTLIELIPIAEEKYRQYGNERSAYALGALISQCRELVGDIKAERDSRGIALHLSHAIIHPMFISIMQNIVDNLFQLKKGVESYVPPARSRDTNNLIDQTAREITHYLEQSYNMTRDRIVTEMMET